ncbi:MAG: hypothetical protein V1820_00630 [archaeon]
MMRILTALGISLLLGIIVFFSGQMFASPAHAFYAGLVVFLSGTLLAPVVVSKRPEEEHQMK